MPKKNLGDPIPRDEPYIVLDQKKHLITFGYVVLIYLRQKHLCLGIIKEALILSVCRIIQVVRFTLLPIIKEWNILTSQIEQTEEKV